MSEKSDQEENRFLSYLFNLADSQARGELAVLRRGLSYPPASDVAMYPYIARFIKDDMRNTYKEKVYYMTASLFAYHPANCSEGNFGSHMLKAAGENEKESTERRFIVLLNAFVDDLPDYIRQSVSLLKSKEIAVNWQRFFVDLMGWNHPSKYVQRQWANSFWGYSSNTKDHE